MEYKISKEQLKLAKKLGVMIYPADANSVYKIEIYDSQGVYLTSVGDKRYNDYFIYKAAEKRKEIPKGYANWRRSLYLQRHEKELEKVGSRGWYNAILNWNYSVPKDSDSTFANLSLGLTSNLQGGSINALYLSV
jgi:hypothetical protein